jgi:hypothetical protein
MNKLAVALIVSILVGCATSRPHVTREEWLSVTSRTYDGVTKEQIIGAAEQLFRLADGDDFDIVHTEEGISTSRKWFALLITGTDYWQIKAVPVGNQFRVTVHVSTHIDPMDGTTRPTTTTVDPAFNPVRGTAIYDIFWSRLDYLLGERADWMTCKTADDRVDRRITWGGNSALCNSFNVEDKTPTKPFLSNVLLQKDVTQIK